MKGGRVGLWVCERRAQECGFGMRGVGSQHHIFAGRVVWGAGTARVKGVVRKRRRISGQL